MPNRRITEVPTDKVDQVVSDFEYEGCTNVTRTQVGENSWTVEADCPTPGDTTYDGTSTG